jgi:hypothetical protein
MGGTESSSTLRRAIDMPRPNSLPALMLPMPSTPLRKAMSTLPDSRSSMLGSLPL